MLVFGLLGYLMKIYGFEPAPLVLGVVLADILESNFRRTLIIAATKGGLVPYFFSRPIAIVIVVVILVFALVPVIRKMQAKKAAANSFKIILHIIIKSAHSNDEVMNMIDNHELPIGFTMELAQHSDILNRFAALSHEEQERYIDGSREVESRQEMKNYVENMFRG